MTVRDLIDQNNLEDAQMRSSNMSVETTQEDDSGIDADASAEFSSLS